MLKHLASVSFSIQSPFGKNIDDKINLKICLPYRHKAYQNYSNISRKIWLISKFCIQNIT